MADQPPIADTEVVMRHIPNRQKSLAVGPRITSANFELRAHINETYVSLSRQSITTVEELFRLVRAKPGARVATAKVGDIRRLGLRVEPHASTGNPGHCGIESGEASLEDEVVQMKLAELFQLLPEQT